MSSAAELIERLRAKIQGRPELLTSVGAVFKFVLEGEGGGTYVLDLEKSLAIRAGDGPASCTLALGVGDFVDLFEGRADGQALFMTGKLRVDGDLGLALKLQALTGLLR